MSGIYLAGCEPASGKSAVALGLQQLLVRRVSRLGVFRPVVAGRDGTDPLLDLLRSSGGACAPYDASVGVTYEQVRRDEARALDEIVARYHALAAACDQVLVVGTDYAGVGTESEFAFNARVALNLGLPVIWVVSGHDRRPDEIDAALSVARGALERSDCEVAAAIANRVPRDAVAALEARLAGTPYADTFVIP